MSDLGFFIIFFVGIIFLAFFVGDNDQGIFSDPGTATSTPSTGVDSELTYTRPTESTSTQPPPTYQSTNQNSYTNSNPPSYPSTRLSNIETERRIAELSRTLDTLEESVREAKLREPASPFQGDVELSAGSTYETNPDREYLTLRATNGVSENGINISNWYFESYVTNETAGIPEGDRIISRWRSPGEDPIVLLPNEQAYVISGDSPINASFRENACTGYLQREEVFYPSLNSFCPIPLSEMKKFGNIDLDNDSCYDFVQTLNYCTAPTNDVISAAGINSSCRRFVENTLNYNDCVSLHSSDPLFDDVGYWYIYLERNEDLWRGQREIIRLMDEYDRVVDVIEY